MSYHLHSRFVFDSRAFARDTAVPIAGESACQGAPADLAIDAALKSVPLPDGLMTRLGKLAFTVSDEAADQVDWLGC